LTRFDFESFRQQEMVFAVLNLFVLGALLLLHLVFSSLLGSPSPSLLLTLGAAFLVRMLELLWLWARAPLLTKFSADFIAWASIAFNLGLALLLTLLTNREDSPYFVLLALPVLQSAYRLGLSACIGVLVVSDAMTFFWVWHFARFHPPVHVSEYFEAGVISLVYALMGLLVRLLVNQLRRDQKRLSDNFHELQNARERLLVEEKLAAVGRLSSAVAHEIRNPVAIINSSLTTAERSGLAEEDRKDMYSIARREAARLEKLTSDFLGYARPSPPQRMPVMLAEVLGYIADVARMQASKKAVTISVEADPDLRASVDRDQIQRALLNLLLNATDATSEGRELEDIPGLCEVLSIQIARELKVRPKPLSQDALDRISQYAFQGNIRELRNLLERAHILSRGEEIGASDLPIEIGKSATPERAMGIREWIETLPATVDLRELITLFERGLLERAMEQANGVQAEAARMLGLSRSDMGYKVAKYAISV
jgi:signal transduction histidine kinase